MKKIYPVLMIASAISFSCAKENIQTPDTPEVPEKPAVANFSLCANIDDTRTVNDNLKTAWAEGDAIQVFHQDCDETIKNDGKFALDGDPANGMFKGTLNPDWSDGSTYNLWAVYPYSDTNSDPSICTVTIGGKTQTQKGKDSMAHLAGETAPLAGMVTATMGEVPHISMSQLATVVSIAVTNCTKTDLTVNTLTFKGVTEEIAGEFNVDLTAENWAYTAMDAAKDVVLNISGENNSIAPGTEGRFFFVLKPFAVSKDQILSIDIDGRTFYSKVTNDINFPAGTITNLSLEYKTQVTFDGPGAGGWGTKITADINNNPDGTYSCETALNNGYVAIYSSDTSNGKIFLLEPVNANEDISAGGVFSFVKKTGSAAAIAQYWNKDGVGAGRYRFTFDEKAGTMKVEVLKTITKLALNGNPWSWSEYLPTYTLKGNVATFVVTISNSGTFAIYDAKTAWAPNASPINITASGWTGTLAATSSADDFFTTDVPGTYRFVLDYDTMELEIRPEKCYLCGPGLEAAGGWDTYIPMEVSSDDIAVYSYTGNAVKDKMITMFTQKGKGQLNPVAVSGSDNPNYSLDVAMGICIKGSADAAHGFFTSNYESGQYTYTINLRDMTFKVTQ
ncbi:MAG: fimbrillin family protein [Candidatus Cryptobacteroides sp.]